MVQRFGYNKTTISISKFAGTRAIEDLPAIPTSLCSSRKEREIEAIARGRLFQKFQAFHYVAYAGTFRNNNVTRQVWLPLLDETLAKALLTECDL